jgi:hypothetical protein
VKRLTLALVACLTLSAGVASAEPINLDIGTPPVVVVRHAMTQRQSRLERFYKIGVIGLGNDGMLQVRDSSGLTLAQRQIAEKLVDHENNDRESLITAIAEAHEGKQARRDEVRAALLARWQGEFKPGWWLQDAQGHWFQKP